MGIYDILSILRYPIGWCLDTLTSIFNNVPILVSIGSYGLAIVVTTLAIRALLFPIFGWQLRTTRRVQSEQRKVAPDIQRIRKQYRKDPRKMSEEMQKVYAEHGISPFSGLMGCVPALVQAPVLIGLYRAIYTTNQSLTSGRGFLWISDVSHNVHDLCTSCTNPFHGGTASWIADILVGFLHQPALLILPLVAAIATYMQSRMMMPPIHDDMTDQERSMVGMTKNMSYIFPVMIFMMSLNFAQGLALYWVTSTCLMVLQQYHLVGWGSLNVPGWIPGAHRTTALSYQKPGAPPRPFDGGQVMGGVDSNGKNPSGIGVPGRKLTRAERERVSVAPSGMGQGRTPGRTSSASKKKRRR